jgi:hypothetical protein
VLAAVKTAGLVSRLIIKTVCRTFQSALLSRLLGQEL